jgi:GntR family transcriptional regulator/MocR family aminotransferase
MDTLFEINLELAARGPREASRTLHRELKSAIVTGRLPPGARLPGTRRSGTYFGVSRNTAAEVYERLLSEGYLIARQGSGTYVARAPPPRQPAPAPAGEAPPLALNEFWRTPEVSAALDYWNDPESAAAPGQGEIELRPAIVDARLFPLDVLRRVNAAALRALENKPARYHSPHGNAGHYPLRVAIAGHIGVTRGLACQPEDVLVTAGGQQAFDLAARVLVKPGMVVAVEDPGYPPLRVPFAACGARVVPVPVDAEGLIPEAVPANARIICVTPSHQFPLGVTQPAPRRAALLALARRQGAVIIEDDYDGEFRCDGRPLQALHSAAAEYVCYVGTFSKCMLPSLRLGYMVLPRWARPSFIAARNALDWHSPLPLQLAVARFISAGHLALHVRRMREVYRRRRQTLLAALDQRLPRWLEPIPSLYGMHVTAAARPGVGLGALDTALRGSGVRLHTLSRYYLGKETRCGLVLGCAVADEAAIRQAVQRLRGALARIAVA